MVTIADEISLETAPDFNKSQNINQNDVWLYGTNDSGQEDTLWSQVDSAEGNNAIYNQLPTTPYIAPAYNEVVGTQQEKMIAGHSDGGAQNCHVVGGSYLTESMNFATGVPSNGGYYFVMDYRILPGLPAVFPFHRAPRNANSTSPSLVAADVAAGGALGHDGGLTYAAPGVYTMYIKYIIAEDQ